MWTLITELSLLFLIAALIGWLMGRYLCKSGEVEERSHKNKYQKERDLLQSELKQCDEAYQSALQQNNQSEKLLAEYEQQISSLQGQLGILTEEREKLLDDLQELNLVNSQLNALKKDHKYEQEHHRLYRDKSIKLTEQRDALIDVRNNLNEKAHLIESRLQEKTFEAEVALKNNANFEREIKKLEIEKEDIIQTIKIEKSQIVQQLERENEKAIQRLEIERDKELQRLKIEHDEIIKQIKSSKQTALEELEKNKTEAIQKLSSENNSLHLQLKNITEEYHQAQNHNQKSQSKIQLFSQENEALKQRIEQNEKDYALIQKKNGVLTEESISFGRRLEELINEKNELRRSVEAITIENNDYLGRLRAISSVIDVVGTEPNRIISLDSAN